MAADHSTSLAVVHSQGGKINARGPGCGSVETCRKA